ELNSLNRSVPCASSHLVDEIVGKSEAEHARFVIGFNFPATRLYGHLNFIASPVRLPANDEILRCHCKSASSLASMRSPHCLARAAWGRCIEPAIRASDAMWP